MAVKLRTVIVLCCFPWLSAPAFGQQAAANGAPAASGASSPAAAGTSASGTSAAGTSAAATGSATTGRIEAILPKRDPNLIFVEGEDAIATNFAQAPVLNYDCSGFRTLQLNKSAALDSGTAYFADFSFYVESTGTYELWYGGTPPASKDGSHPSYASPFDLIIDKTSTFEIHRESVHVVENYTPAYYWNLVGDFPFQRGIHRLSFEIRKPRNYDGRYFFYLDNFFLIKKENGQRLPVTIKPALFPHNMDDRSIDKDFSSIDDYEKRIKANPDDAQADIDLATIYSMVGDYYSALKYLHRADLIDPQRKSTMLLIAKNTLWKGDTNGALELYKNLLQYYGDDLGLWLEAGKVAAWTGHYTASVGFFDDALKKFPKNLSLVVNRGLSELWAGEAGKAQKDFQAAFQETGRDIALRKELASIYTINGYPDRAVPIYRDSLAIAPADVELYALLYKTLEKMNKTKEAKEVRDEMGSRFIPSPGLSAYLEVLDKESQLKDLVLQDYRRQLSVEPDNLELRKVIAEADFWNGDMKAGIKEYENIVANYIYLQVRSMEKDSAEYMGILDRAAVYARYLADLPRRTAEYARRLTDRLAAIQQAQGELAQKKLADAELKKNGKAPDVAGENDLVARLAKRQSELGGLLNELSAFEATAGSLADRFKADQDREAALSHEDAAQAKSFASLTKDTRWKWDRDATYRELENARQDGTSLATYALGRIAFFEGDTDAAARYFGDLAKARSTLAGAPYGLMQARLADGQVPSADAVKKDAGDSEDPFTSLRDDLSAYLGAVQEQGPAPGFLTEDPRVAVGGALKDLAALRDTSFARGTAVYELEQKLHSLLVRRMERSFYNLAQDTSSTHNELGGFYQTAKRYGDAIDQFEQVMAVDPWNEEAIFKLGQVYQYNGNWRKAQALYRKVYDQDPYYNNVTHFYNELERQYADRLDASSQAFADTTRYTQSSSIDWNSHLSEQIGIAASEAAVYQRFPIAPTGSSLSDRLTVSLPLNPFGPALTVTPYAGGLGYSNWAGTGTVSGTPGIGTFLSSISPRPLGGLGASWRGKSASASLSYGFDTIEDTITNNGPLYAQTLQGAGTLYFRFINVPVVSDSSLTLSGSAQSVEDGALLWMLGGGLTVPLTLANSPHIGLAFSFPWSYQDSLGVPSPTPSYTVYYQELTYQAGLSLSGDFDAKPGLTIGQTLQAAGGYDGELVPITTVPTQWQQAKNFIFSVESDTEFRTETYTVYLDLIGTGKNQYAPTAIPLYYWSLQVNLGVRFHAPNFLVP
ncbi:MAG TPA: tetratricopeptide repeat protein [Rectinemataceae bacterium]|nr:tetratricopeptide repeat protein [Rectinemataceae bacterium]